jgi:hypothetical protein
MSEPPIKAKNKEEDNPSKQADLDESLNNVSIISEKNHEHYKFDTNIKLNL